MPLPLSATHWPVFDIKEKEHLQIIVRLRAVLGHASWRPPQASNVPAAPWILSLKMLRTYLLAWCRNNPTIDEETFQFDHVCWIPVILVALSYKLLHCGAGLALSVAAAFPAAAKHTSGRGKNEPNFLSLSVVCQAGLQGCFDSSRCLNCWTALIKQIKQNRLAAARFWGLHRPGNFRLLGVAGQK